MGSSSIATTIVMIGLLTLAQTPAGDDSTPGSSSARGERSSRKARLASRSLLLAAERRGSLVLSVGERGHILASEDNGLEWIQRTVPTRATLTGIAFASDRQVFVVGHESTILRSTDGGQSWSVVHENRDGDPLFDIWFANDLEGIAVGAYGLALETSDGGLSWTRRSLMDADEAPHFYAIEPACDGKSIYVVGEFGTVLRSTNGGTTWHPMSPPYRGTYFGLLSLPTKTGEVLLVHGLRGHGYYSLDGGTSWTPSETSTKQSLLSACQCKDGSIAMVGLSGTVLVSRDDMRTFRQVRTGFGRLALVDAVPIDEELLLFGEKGTRRLSIEPTD